MLLIKNRHIELFLDISISVLLMFALFLTSTQVNAQENVDYQGVVIGPSIPPDVTLNQENRQRDMDLFSWNSFIALNWPVAKDKSPDLQKVIGASPDHKHGNGDQPTVWEAWMSTSDLLDIPEGKEPVWGERYVPNECAISRDYKEGIKILDQAAKSDDFFEESFDTGPLVDQSANFIRYEILINKDMFNTIKDNKLYSKSGQAKASSVNFSCGDNSTGAEGAIMIKAAWRMLTKHDPKHRFHSEEAMVFTPAKYRSDKTDHCEKVDIGLVGMHIVHKTVKQPQWIWSSFEQIDNVPDCENQNTFFSDPLNLHTPSCPTEVSDTKSYNFFSAKTHKKTSTECNSTPYKSSDMIQLNKPGNKSQLCRENALETSAPPVNTAYQVMLKAINERSVWQHYQLIGTQWNSKIHSHCSLDTKLDASNVLPQYKQNKIASAEQAILPMANSTMESYEQNGNCMSCHVGASIGSEKSQIPSDFVYFLSQEVD